MLAKILLATDGSDYSTIATDYALDFAEKNGSEVEILTVTPPISYPVTPIGTEFAPQAPLFLEEIQEAAQMIIERAAEKFEAKGVSFTTRIDMGDPAEVICAEAEKHHVDLIIMGTRGKTGISRFLMGSVSTRVVNHAACSVLVVR